MKKTIQLSIKYYDEERIVSTCERSYRNLMVLIKDQIGIEDFGACGGQGKCATCIVKLESGNITSHPQDSNEYTTLFKMGITNPNIRLACQVPISTSINQFVFTIVEEA